MNEVFKLNIEKREVKFTIYRIAGLSMRILITKILFPRKTEDKNWILICFGFEI